MIDVVPAWDAKPAQRAFDSFVDHPLEITAPTLDLAHKVAGHVERLAHIVEQRLPAVVNRIGTCINQSRRTALFHREHELREDDLGQILTRVPVDDLDLVTVPHQVGDTFERDVAARLRVVQLAIRILLDKVSLGGHRQVSTVMASQY